MFLLLARLIDKTNDNRAIKNEEKGKPESAALAAPGRRII